MAPFVVCVWILGALCATTWVLSLATGEHSWVDRIWSVAPVAYVWVFASAAGLGDARVTVMAVLVTLWGVRLTFNYARKGGYAPGGEDYRWKMLRERMPRWQFQLFSLFFISVFQNIVIMLITMPILTAYLNPAPLGVADLVIALLFLAALVGETVADQQQWVFQRRKAAERVAGLEPQPRFLQTGLFRLSRHPNFFFEQLQWWLIYLFTITATGAVLHWSVVGAALLTLVFSGSTAFTESISRSRYPEYAQYQRHTSPIIPWVPRAKAEPIKEHS